MDYAAHIADMFAIYFILAVALNLVMGMAGLVSVAHAALFGLGGYVAALATLKGATIFPVDLIAAAIFGAAGGLGLGVMSLRVREDYFVLLTYATQMVAFSLYNNLDLTGGPLGIAAIPPPHLGHIELSTPVSFLLLAVLVALAVAWGAVRIQESPFGRVLRAIREDEILAISAGKDVVGVKCATFALSGAIAALAGGLYARYITFIDPSSFTVSQSLFVMSMVIVGGAGRLPGVLIGTAILIFLPEALRLIGFDGASAGNMRQIILGALLIGFMVWRPMGIAGDYSFRRSRL